MVRKGKQIIRKGKTEIPEEDEKQNELILEEVLSISGKSSEKADGSTPARQKRASSKPKEIASTEPKKSDAKKRSLSPSSLPPKKKKSFNKQEEEEGTTAANEVKTKASERGDPVTNLPDGWRRQVAVRKSGKSAGQVDIYFFSPDGVKLRSRPDVLSYLKLHKSSLKIEAFDFSKGNRASKATEKVTASESKKKSATENNSVPKKKTVHEKSKAKAEPKELSKNTTTKMSKSVKKASEVPAPAVPETEENDAAGKANKVVSKKKITKAKKKTSGTSTSRKRKSEALEDKKQIPSKKLQKKESSSAKLKKKKDKKSESKKVEAKKEKPTKENAVNEVKTSERGVPVPNLPDGWRREVVARKSGERAGQTDIYFFSPDGVKLRSRPDVLSYLKKHKSDLKIEDFDFSRTAKTAAANVKKATTSKSSMGQQKKRKTAHEEESNAGMDSSDKVPEPTGKPSKILRKILEPESN